MANKSYCVLPGRGIISVTGEDRKTYLQGIISNDIEKVAPGSAIYAAFLTAQGKFLHDFLVSQQGDALLIDCEAERLADLKKRLTMYKLRSKVALEDVTEVYDVVALFGDATPVDAAGTFPDPRLSAMGARAIVGKGQGPAFAEGLGFERADFAAYEALRLSNGIPDGSRDMVVDKAILLENGFDELNGVDWDKGCYMGQELTARTRYRGLIKKRLLPVTFDGPAPAPGTKILADGKDAGEMRSGTDGKGLALIRMEKLDSGAALDADGVTLTASKPDWFVFETKDA